MKQPLLTLLALLAPIPALAGQSVTPDYADLCARLAAELAAVGVPVDLSRLTIEVLPQTKFRADAEALDAYFRPQGFYEAQYLVREAMGQEPGVSVAAMKAEITKRRVEAEPVHYHFGRDALVFLEDEPLALRERLVAAALAVAWRDQQHDLAEVMKLEDPRLELTLVRAALIYGEAEAAVHRLFDARAGEDGRLTEDQLELAVRARGLDAFWERVRIEGRRFCERRLREPDGQEASSAYWSSLPLSTEQVLHETKWQRDRPEPVALPEWPAKIENTTLLHVDTIGELGMFAILVQSGVPRAKAFEISVGWDGDLMHVYHVEGQKNVLVWRTVWDRQRDAEQFARIWRKNSVGEVRVGGRTVDWVFAQEQGPWKKVLLALENNTPKLSDNQGDGLTTHQIEEEYQRDRAVMPYVTANLWRHPKYDLTLPVPIGWYEDMERGTSFIARTGSGGGFTDTVRVGARSNRAKLTIEQLLEQNRAALDLQDDRTPIKLEMRELDGRQVAFLRYEGRDGGHKVIYTSALFLHRDKQVAITISIEDVRWPELHIVIDECIAGIKFGPLEKMDR